MQPTCNTVVVADALQENPANDWPVTGAIDISRCDQANREAAGGRARVAHLLHAPLPGRFERPKVARRTALKCPNRWPAAARRRGRDCHYHYT
jgi:hypothetical protein